MNLASIKTPVADRSGLRALLRLPRRRDEPVVSGPRLRQPPGRAARLSGGGLPLHHRHHRQGARVHPRREGGRTGQAVLPLLLRPGPATRRTTRPRSGSTSTRASSTWATRRTASSSSSGRRSSASSPTCAELSPINPVRRRDEPRRASRGRKLDTVRPWDSLSGGRAAAVRAHGRGVRRLPEPRRPRDRAAPRPPRGDAASSTTPSIVLVSDNGASGEGGPNGSVNENKFFNGLPDTIEENLQVPRRSRQPQDVQPLPDRLGVGVQHAVQAVEALQQLGGRHRRPDDRVVAGPDHGGGRCAASTRHAVDIVPTLYECLGVELPRRVNGPHPAPARRRQLRRRRSPTPRPKTGKETQFYSMLGTRAIWHQGWKAAALSPAAPDAWARIRAAALGALRHRERPERVPRPRRPSSRRSCRS